MAKLPPPLDLLTATVLAAQHRMPLFGVVDYVPDGLRTVRTMYYCRTHLNSVYSPYERIDVLAALTGEENPMDYARVAYVSRVPINRCRECKHVKIRRNDNEGEVDEWRGKKPHHR